MKFLDQGCPKELPVMMELFYKPVLSNEVATSHKWLRAHEVWLMQPDELNFYRYLILIKLRVNSHVWLVATILDNIVPDHGEKKHDVCQVVN